MESEHVAQSAWQGSHVFVEVFPYFPEGHAVRHCDPSRNFPTGQVEHCVGAGPVHVAQLESQPSQVLVRLFSMVPRGQLVKH